MQHIKRNKWKLAAAGLIALYGGVAVAGQVGTINTFSAGSPAVAADVNANFNEHTTQINDNDTRIQSLENEVFRAGLVTVDCAAGQTVTGALGLAPLKGWFTVDISGTCDENVDIKKRKVKFISSSGNGAIIATTDTTAPAMRVSRGSGAIVINGITIGGGSNALVVAGNSEVTIVDSVIGDANTVDYGLLVMKGAVVTVSNSSGASSTFTAGNSGNGAAVSALGGAIVQFKKGATTLNGNGGVALMVDAGSRVLGFDIYNVPEVTINGGVEVGISSSFGMSWGTINGNISAWTNAAVNLNEADSATMPLSVTGDLNAIARAIIQIEGGTSVTGNATVSQGGAVWIDTLAGSSLSGTCTATDTISLCL